MNTHEGDDGCTNTTPATRSGPTGARPAMRTPGAVRAAPDTDPEGTDRTAAPGVPSVNVTASAAITAPATSARGAARARRGCERSPVTALAAWRANSRGGGVEGAAATTVSTAWTRSATRTRHRWHRSR